MEPIAVSEAVPPRRRARRNRSVGTRQAVTDAVRELLKERRLDELMVNEIVERAGISRPTFYAHFDTKYSVVASLISETGDTVIDVWSPLFDGDGPIDPELLHDVSVATIQLWRPRAALFTATVEGWHSDREIHDAWNEILERFTEAFLARIRRERELEPSDDMLAGALVSVFERCLYLAFSMPDSSFARDDEELAAMLSKLWIRALRTD